MLKNMKCKLTIMKLKESINPLMSNVAQMNEYGMDGRVVGGGWWHYLYHDDGFGLDILATDNISMPARLSMIQE